MVKAMRLPWEELKRKDLVSGAPCGHTESTRSCIVTRPGSLVLFGAMRSRLRSNAGVARH